MKMLLLLILQLLVGSAVAYQARQEPPPPQPGRIGGVQRQDVLAIEGASPSETDAWDKISRAEDVKKKGELALEYLKKYPQGVFVPYVHGILAMLYEEKNDTDRFIEHAELSLKSLPDEVNLLASLSVKYAEKQMPNEAIQYGEAALSILPTAQRPEAVSVERWEEIRVLLTSDAHYGVGTGYLFRAFNSPGNAQLMTTATDHLVKSVEKKPSGQAAQFRLGFAYDLQNQPEKAIPCYASAAALKGPNAGAARQYLENAYQKVHGNTKGVDKLISQEKKRLEAGSR